MKIVIETNGTLTECRISGHSYSNPTIPYFNEAVENCDFNTKHRVLDALKAVEEML